MEAIPFDLHQVFENLSNFTATKAQKKGLELLFVLPDERHSRLVGDPLRLGQVLLNLVSNAIKFTEQGEVRVSAKPLSVSDGAMAIEFSVQDTGIGLTEEQCERLFKPFSQADTSTTRKYGGSGLGLAISKYLVEKMDGAITLQSEFGKGSTFTFTARFGREQGEDAPKPKFLPTEMQQIKVLVVDDVDSALEVMSAMLGALSCRVTCVKSGTEALEALEHAPDDDPYNLVFMDWNMPEIDGIEASRRIKQHPYLAHIPTIIMITAYGREMIMAQVEETKIDGFLIKPVTPSMLTDAIVGVLGPRHGRERVEDAAQAWGIHPMSHILNARILLVEDNAINRQLAMEFLKQAGLVVTLAGNGQEAVDLVERSLFDAVLMDIHMPVMDGYQAARIIRSIPGREALPIIAMTANAMAGDREKCLAAGMNDHVAKPIDPEQLLAALNTWVTPGVRELPADIAPAAKAAFTAPPKNPLPEELPGIDMKVALQGAGRDDGLLYQVLMNFLHDHEGDARALRRALKESDLELAGRIAHTLKGLAGVIGAEELRPAAAALDTAIRTRAEDSYGRRLDRVENALSRVTDGLKALGRHHPERGASSANAKPNEVSIRAQIERLEAMMREMDPDAEAEGRVLRRMIGSSPMQPLAEELERQLGNFDFENGQYTLHQLKQEMKAQHGQPAQNG